MIDSVAAGRRARWPYLPSSSRNDSCRWVRARWGPRGAGETAHAPSGSEKSGCCRCGSNPALLNSGVVKPKVDRSDAVNCPEESNVLHLTSTDIAPLKSWASQTWRFSAPNVSFRHAPSAALGARLKIHGEYLAAWWVFVLNRAVWEQSMSKTGRGGSRRFW